MNGNARLQAISRAKIRAERKGDPSWVDLGDGWFALHIQYGGNAVTVHFDGSGDSDAFREWLEYHWPIRRGASNPEWWTPERTAEQSERMREWHRQRAASGG